MNPVALITMAGLALWWLILTIAALVIDCRSTFAFLVLSAIGLFLYAPWVRLRVSKVDQPGWRAHFWIDLAMFAVCLATVVAMIVMMARWIGVL